VQVIRHGGKERIECDEVHQAGMDPQGKRVEWKTWMTEQTAPVSEHFRNRKSQEASTMSIHIDFPQEFFREKLEGQTRPRL
jgi:hypothetical protein